MHRRISFYPTLLATLCLSTYGSAQTLTQPQAQITQVVDESTTVTLVGNVHPLVGAATSSVAADLGTPMQHMVLNLKGSAAQEAALDQLIAAQGDPKSPLYHQYLTPQTYGATYGAATADVAQVTVWLQNHGFHVEQVTASNRAIVFSGTAAQVNSTFKTSIHQLIVGGVTHLANVSDPQIPAAFANTVVGVVTLHDFRRTSNIAKSTPLSASAPTPQYSSGSTHYLTPADYTIIYDIGPLYKANINGSGQSIAIIARSNISMTDVQLFRSTFGLAANNPQIIITNSDPGVVSGDNEETTLDTEWSGAVAPNATVKVIVSSSGTSDGIDLSSLYAVNNNVAPIISLSYGSCELGMGSSGTNFYSSLWKQAVAQGQTVLVSSGDSGAAGCDSGSTSTYGRNINGLCSSPYATCVGGTMFSDTSNPGQYWLTANSPTYGSAISYIPEAVWNESGSNGGSGLWAGGGGASIYFSKPSWQTGPGVPNDGKRDVPDMSLAAAGHDGYFIGLYNSFYTVGGTSAAAPSFAGMMALVNQKINGHAGLAQAVLYPLAAAQAAGGAAVFHDITVGNNTVPGTTGYAAGPGYDLATGLGTIDANLLVNNWGGSSTAATVALTASTSTVTLTAGTPAQVTITSAASATLKSAVALSVSGAPAGMTASLAAASIASPGSGSDVLTLTGTSALAAGNYTLTVTGTAGTQTAKVTIAVTVLTPSFSIAGALPTMTLSVGSAGQVTVTTTPKNGFNSTVTLSVVGLPTGVTAAYSPTTLAGSAGGSSTLKLTAGSTATAGSYTLTIRGTAGTEVENTTLALNILSPTFAVTPNVSSLSVVRGNSGQVTVAVTALNGFSSAVNLSITGMPTGMTAAFSPAVITGTAGGNSTLTFTVGATTPVATYPLTITGTSTGSAKTASLSLMVTAPPSCTLASNPASVTLAPSASATLQLSCGSATGTFSGALTGTLSGAPTGMTAQLASSTLTPGSTTNLAITTAASMATGNYSLTYKVTGSGFTQSLNIPVTVQAVSKFTLAASASTLAVKAGASGAVNVTSSLVGNFNSAISFSAVTGSTATNGLSVTFSKTTLAAPGSGTITATIAASSSVAAGTYTVNITGVSGQLSQTVPISVTVSGNPSFTFTVSTTAMTVARGSSGKVTESTGSYAGGFNGQLTVTLTGLPYGANYSVAGANTNNNQVNITYAVSAASGTPVGTYPITFTASGSGVTHTAVVQLTVK